LGCKAAPVGKEDCKNDGSDKPHFLSKVSKTFTGFHREPKKLQQNHQPDLP
jgi:hypothetical protein